MVRRSWQANSFPERVKRLKWLGLASTFLVASLLRSIDAIHHLIPDPGLGFQVSAWSDDLSDVFGRYGGYPQVAPRAISELLNLVPLSQLTYWATALNSVVVAICSVVIAIALTPIIGFRLAALPGLFLAVTFPAHEGLVGNIWALRWLLLPATCLVVISDFAKKHWRSSLLLFVVTGLSHAYIVIPAIVFLARAWVERDGKPKTALHGFALIGMALFQGYAFWTGPRSTRLYGDNTAYWPWTGSGIYWLAVFILPLGLALISVGFSIAKSRTSTENWPPHLALSLQATLLAITSYLQLGIKSSPAVASTSVSYAAVILATSTTGQTFGRIKFPQLVAFATTLIMLILSIRYFLASSYLTNGLPWSQIVAQGVTKCKTTGVSQIELTYFTNGDLTNSELLSCQQVRSWVEWFFRR